MLRLPGTIRLRLTLAYGGLFLLCGAAVLTITYFLVRQQYTGSFFVSSGKAGLAAVTAKAQSVPVPKSLPLGKPPPPLNGIDLVKIVAAGANAQSAAALHKLLVDCGIALAVMGALSLWLGWFVAGRALQPLRTITNTTRQISASNLHRRLGLRGPDDELKQLGDTVDGLLERLESAFAAQRQFVANASHELRTPLTLERTLLELALSDPDATVESLRRTCEQVLAAGRQQERLIEALLTLSRSQRGLDQREPVDLASTTEAATAAVHHDGLAVNVKLDAARTVGDTRLVERLVANLVGNAVRHNVPNGSVHVRTQTRNGHAVLTVANSGAAIPPEEVERLFRPFQRLDAGRTADPDGLGLGLSIVDAIARAHDATVTATAPADGGLRVEVAFPSA